MCRPAAKYWRTVALGLAVGLWAVSVVLWGRSYRVWENVVWVPHEYDYSLRACDGSIGVMFYQRFEKGYHDGPHWRDIRDYGADGSLFPVVEESRQRFGPFGWGKSHAGSVAESKMVFVAFPFWLVCGGTTALVLIAARAWWRRPDRLAGRCARCGYDLRMTPNRCPECGTPVPAATSVRGG
jgi:hypothetical protein